MVISLAVALALVFTPCCELFAAGGDAHHAGPQQLAHGHAPQPDSFCATTLDEMANPLVDLAAPASRPQAVAWSVPPVRSGQVRRAAAPRVVVDRFRSVGPPLYLRYAQLLL
jgi:hypothetical protein